MGRYYCVYCSEELSGEDVDWLCDNCGAQFWGLAYDEEGDEETMDEVRGIAGKFAHDMRWWAWSDRPNGEFQDGSLRGLFDQD